MIQIPLVYLNPLLITEIGWLEKKHKIFILIQQGL